MQTKVMTAPAGNVSDLTFDDYTKRQLSEISAERVAKMAVKVAPAGNFYYENHVWQPNEYEGFAVVSMLNANDGNQPLTTRLTELQKDFHYNLQPTYAFYHLPPESFHQTVANTLSDDRFKRNILDKGLEDVYPSIVRNAFDRLSPVEEIAPIRMKMVGLSIFGTAIGMLGIFENEEDYNRITNFREGFYADERLAELDVKMTRPFIGHITLMYIEHALNKNQKNHLAGVINEANATLSQENNNFYISNTGLRRYHHLAEFIHKDDYPTCSI